MEEILIFWLNDHKQSNKHEALGKSGVIHLELSLAVLYGHTLSPYSEGRLSKSARSKNDFIASKAIIITYCFICGHPSRILKVGYENAYSIHVLKFQFLWWCPRQREEWVRFCLVVMDTFQCIELLCHHWLAAVHPDMNKWTPSYMNLEVWKW